MSEHTALPLILSIALLADWLQCRVGWILQHQAECPVYQWQHLPEAGSGCGLPEGAARILQVSAPGLSIKTAMSNGDLLSVCSATVKSAWQSTPNPWLKSQARLMLQFHWHIDKPDISIDCLNCPASGPLFLGQWFKQCLGAGMRATGRTGRRQG